jgi:hypothetical protein
LRQSRVEIVAFIIVSCLFVPVIGSLSAGALHRLIRSGPLLATYLCLHRGTLTKNVAGRQSRFLKKSQSAKNCRKKLYVVQKPRDSAIRPRLIHFGDSDRE